MLLLFINSNVCWQNGSKEHQLCILLRHTSTPNRSSKCSCAVCTSSRSSRPCSYTSNCFRLNMQIIPVSCQNHLHGLGLAYCSDQSLCATHAWDHSQLDLWLQHKRLLLCTIQDRVQNVTMQTALLKHRAGHAAIHGIALLLLYCLILPIRTCSCDAQYSVFLLRTRPACCTFHPKRQLLEAVHGAGCTYT